MEEKELFEVFNILSLLSPITNSLDSISFGALYCMLLEEWCRANNEDIVAYIKELAEHIVEVNEEYGSY